MLVLSRKESDKIVFPSVGITVEILRIQGGTIRVGIDAPAEIPIYRHEIVDLKGVDFVSEGGTKEQIGKLTRAVQQRLHTAAAKLNALHQHAEGDPQTQALILDAFQELKALDHEANAAIDADDERSTRALLVENDAHSRELLAGYLRLRGIETTTATDGLDALDYLSLHTVPDVILLDMHMPRCDGPCLVENIRSDADCRQAKLFAVSRADPSRLGVPAGPSGVDRWFPKPIDPELLIRGIAEETGIPSAA